MKVAIVHYWFTNWRGGEKVVAEILKLYPEADVYTHVADDKIIDEKIKTRGRLRKTFISRLPFARRFYQKYLMLMPMALEAIDLSGYDLIISSESGPAKGVIVPPEALHVCYCHSPMRYVWDMQGDYLKSLSKFNALIARIFLHYLRIWDVSSSSRVDIFIANSNFIRKRINKYYRRDAEVIFPPVEVEKYTATALKGDHFLMLGQLVDYKRVDVAIKAFLLSGDRLIIVGEGECLAMLKDLAKGAANIIFKGRLDDSECRSALASARALIFPGTEDFGMVPVEAMACGTPVIAYNRGGAQDSVIDGVTGVLYDDPSVGGLTRAVDRFRSIESGLDSSRIRSHSMKFSSEHFAKRLKKIIESNLF